MKKCAFLLLALLGSFTAFSQGKASVSGTVVDQQTDEPLPGVNITVAGTRIGTATNPEGKFKIILPPGTYTLVIAFVGYKAIKQSITLRADEAQRFTARLAPESQRLGDITVTAKLNRETQSALLLDQKKAVVIKQSIGAVELSQRGVSNAAVAVSKISGIERGVDHRAIVVRGLGDRYNNAYLNGLPLPSNVPTKKLIDLGIFKTEIVRNISVYKTFNPDLYGDYAGASFDIESKEAPRDLRVTISTGLGSNSQTLGGDCYLQGGGRYDWFGFDDGSRREAPYLNIPTEDGTAQLFDSRDYTDYGTRFPKPLFHTGFNPEKKWGRANFNLGLTAGRTFDLKGASALGVFAAGNFTNGYHSYRDGYEGSYNSEGDPLSRYDKADKYAYSTHTTGLINLKYKWNDTDEIEANTLFIHTSSNVLRWLSGRNPEGDAVFIQRGTFRQSCISTTQLLGNHRFDGDRLALDWGASYNWVNDRIPDRRQNILGYNAAQAQYTFALSNSSPSDNQRYWQDITEESKNARASLKWRFGPDAERPRSLDLGVNFQRQEFDFENHQANYEIYSGLRNRPLNRWDLDRVLNLDHLNDGLYALQEQPNTGRFIHGALDIYAGYLSTSLALDKALTISGGLRMEYSKQRTDFRLRTDLLSQPMRKALQNKSFWLPDLNLKWAVSDRSNIRLAGSYTLTRPKFLELAPFYYEDITEKTSGNPNLKNSANTNLDLKYECFPRSGEIFSVAAFAKYIEDPIEKVWASGAGDVKTYINSQSASIYGTELEAQKKLTQNLSLGFNASYIHTRSKTDPNTTVAVGDGKIAITVTTPEDKELQGASQFLLNTDLSYKGKVFKGVTTTATLDYSYTGKRLATIGGDGIGNEYQRPINGLRFILKNQIAEKYALTLAVKNILNAKDERYIDQSGLSWENLTYRYRSGVDFSLSFLYQF